MLAEDGHFRVCRGKRRYREILAAGERKEVDCWESHCMSSFSCCSDQISDNKQLTGGGVYSGSQCEGFQSIMVGKPWQRGLETTGNITSTVKMQRVAGAQPASPICRLRDGATYS